MNPMLRRKRAIDATMAKYRYRAFDWERGATCVHMLRFHANRLGHKLPRVPKVSGPLAAKKALAKHGWDSVTEMLDALFEPIPVAAMLPGDVSVMPGEGGLEGVAISVGSKAIGWVETIETMALIDPTKLEKAWRL